MSKKPNHGHSSCPIYCLIILTRGWVYLTYYAPLTGLPKVSRRKRILIYSYRKPGELIEEPPFSYPLIWTCGNEHDFTHLPAIVEDYSCLPHKTNYKRLSVVLQTSWLGASSTQLEVVVGEEKLCNYSRPLLIFEGGVDDSGPWSARG
jgi:hypothetical protein